MPIFSLILYASEGCHAPSATTASPPLAIPPPSRFNASVTLTSTLPVAGTSHCSPPPSACCLPQTLPLNQGARTALVPKTIAAAPGGLGLVPFPEDVCWSICLAIFDAWDFTAHYAPRDLAARGGEPQHRWLCAACLHEPLPPLLPQSRACRRKRTPSP